MSETIYHLSACADCLMLLANDDTSGNPRCETAEGETAYRAAVADNLAGLHAYPASWPRDDWYPDPDGPEDRDGTSADLIAAVFAGQVDPRDLTFDLHGVTLTGWAEGDRYYGRDCEGRFSWAPCDVCGETLGGDRYPVAAWEVDA